MPVKCARSGGPSALLCHWLPSSMAFSDETTKAGHLPPWETCKAFAFHTALQAIETKLEKRACDLLGERTNMWISRQLQLKGGGCPTEGAVVKAIARCRDEDWYPGKLEVKSGGRKQSFSGQQKARMAAAAMSLKRQIVRPTPARVRAKLPRTCVNPDSAQPVSNFTIYKIFKTMCFDSDEDDPWKFLNTVTKDYLTSAMKPLRVGMAHHILDNMSGAACSHHVGIDPCSSLLPKTAARSEEQRVAALGSKRFMSPKSKFDGVNLRASSFARHQGGRDVLQVHWTPIFARGRVRIFVCDATAAGRDSRQPKKLNDSEELSKFVRHVLPGELDAMQKKYGWTSLPRTIVHDKASYMVNSKKERLNENFGTALRDVGLHSWALDTNGSTKWMASRFSDVYLHETVIAHIRRALEHTFPRSTPGETMRQFRRRMGKVEAYLNSPEFAAKEGGGLPALARDLRHRCAAVIEKSGERLCK